MQFWMSAPALNRACGEIGESALAKGRMRWVERHISHDDGKIPAACGPSPEEWRQIWGKESSYRLPNEVSRATLTTIDVPAAEDSGTNSARVDLTMQSTDEAVNSDATELSYPVLNSVYNDVDMEGHWTLLLSIQPRDYPPFPSSAINPSKRLSTFPILCHQSIHQITGKTPTFQASYRSFSNTTPVCTTLSPTFRNKTLPSTHFVSCAQATAQLLSKWYGFDTAAAGSTEEIAEELKAWVKRRKDYRKAEMYLHCTLSGVLHMTSSTPTTSSSLSKNSHQP